MKKKDTMATTPQDAQRDSEDFATAFDQEQSVRQEPNEDEAFGLEPDAPNEEDAEQVMEPAAEDGEAPGEGATGDAGGQAAPSVTIAVEPGAEENDNAAQAPSGGLSKEEQRLKSWEGRLKARDAMGKSVESEDQESPAEEAAESPAVEAMEEVAAMVESGEMSVEQAINTLSNDFGEDFPKLLRVLIKAEAQEMTGQAGDKAQKYTDGIVGELMDHQAQQHFESIADAHPDFLEVAQGPEFKQYVDGMDETQKAIAMKTIESGSASRIMKLLSDFKAVGATDAGDGKEQEGAMDAAEGVRSSGLKLPSKPAMSDDYSESWDQF